MHYSEKAFALNRNKPTLVALKPMGNAKMGQRERMTESDIKRINKMYCDDEANDEYFYNEETPEDHPWDK
jgi:Astacin (Peptidase family M12A)